MKIKNYIIEAHFHAKQPITHIKLHRHLMYKHFVWWRLSVIFGQPHLMPMTVCSYCYEEIEYKSAGDESWSYCKGCNQVEGDTEEITTEEYEAYHG